MKISKCENMKKSCKTCFWYCEDSVYACGALRSGLARCMPCNAGKFCCFRWEPFILKKHYCCDAEITYTKKDSNIEFIVMINADSKSQYKKDLEKLNDKYGNRVIRLTNYKEIQQKIKKAVAEKEIQNENISKKQV